jgi:hypothetical protein
LKSPIRKRPSSYCYTIVLHPRQKDSEQLQCYASNLQHLQDDHAIHKAIQLSGTKYRVNVHIEIKPNQNSFERWGQSKAMEVINSMSEIDAGDAIETIHNDQPFIYEEKDCDVGKIKFLGNRFVRIVKDRHRELAPRLLEICK